MVPLVMLAGSSCGLVIDLSHLFGGDAGEGGAIDAALPVDVDAALPVDVDATLPVDVDATLPVEAGADSASDASKIPPGAQIWPVNGHGYEVISDASRVTWDDARGRALRAGGHLVTIGSSAENEFVYQVASAVDAVWCQIDNTTFGPWLGAAQSDAAADSLSGWSWVTGEAFVFTAWASGEPNDFYPPENTLAMWGGNMRAPYWNDVNPGRVKLCGYVVEYE